MRSEELVKLVEEERFDELYALVTLDEVADAWLTYHRADSHPDEPDDDPQWWAVQLLFDELDEQRRRDLIRLLVDKAEGEADLGNVAAGPLEAS